MTKKPKKPRDSKYAFFIDDHDGSETGYRVGFIDDAGAAPEIDLLWNKSTKELEDLHRWLGDCIRYIKYRQKLVNRK